jgi:hypothetical protein
MFILLFMHIYYSNFIPTHLIHSYTGIPEDFAGLPSAFVLILLETGLPGVAITLTIGQLVRDLSSKANKILLFFLC